MMKIRKILRVISVVIFAVLLSCCGTSSQDIVVGAPMGEKGTSSTPFNTPAQSIEASGSPASSQTAASAAATPTNTPLPPTPTPESLNQRGPWFVFYNWIDDNYYAVNHDSTGLTKVNTTHTAPGTLAGSPFGGRLAYTTEQSETVVWDISLVIVDLPEIRFETGIPIIERSLRSEMDVFDAMSIEEVAQDMAWSPDGRYLAFNAALDGPNADLYLYDTTTKHYSRLSSGSTHSFDPVWSPDGKSIVYLGIDSINHGLSVQSVWSTDVLGQHIWLFDGKSEPYLPLQYVSNEVVLIEHLNDNYNPIGLYTVNINNPGKTLVYDGYFTKTAVDSKTGNVALVLGAKDDALHSDIAIVSTLANDLSPILLSTGGNILSLEWSSSKQRFVAGLEKQMIQFDSQGVITHTLPYGGIASVSPDGTRVAIYNQSKDTKQMMIVLLGSGMKKSYETGPIDEISWAPDSTGLFFTYKGQLSYLATLPWFSDSPTQISAGACSLTWVP
ncbi:MAG: hypothetical protein U9N80_08250 [Chloroflexota bacterium]|nr:hypothetical protein [Chloroflexota bacterium]